MDSIPSSSGLKRRKESRLSLSKSPRQDRKEVKNGTDITSKDKDRTEVQMEPTTTSSFIKNMEEDSIEQAETSISCESTKETENVNMTLSSCDGMEDEHNQQSTTLQVAGSDELSKDESDNHGFARMTEEISECEQRDLTDVEDEGTSEEVTEMEEQEKVKKPKDMEKQGKVKEVIDMEENETGKIAYTEEEKADNITDMEEQENVEKIADVKEPGKQEEMTDGKEQGKVEKINNIEVQNQSGKLTDIEEQGTAKNKKVRLNTTKQDTDRSGCLKSASKTHKCSICRQQLGPDLSLYGGHPQDAVDEYVALIDPRLSLFTGDENDVNEADQRPQNKLTCFSVYDKEGHLCPIDADLIERNVLLYVSGYMKAIYEENTDPEGGIPCKDVGPINEWYVSGFDGGELALIGISTAYGEYFLLKPSDSYAHLMKSMYEKIYLSKVVIEFLFDEPDASYEDLLNKLETSVPPVNIELTEDSLLRHAQFICDQVHSFDAAGDDGDMLIILPCMRTLIGLAGVTLGKRRAMRKLERRALTGSKQSWTKATTTDLVRNLFDNFFTDQLDGNDEEDRQAPRRQRCGVCETCQMPDCGSCASCKDMTKFGGSGRSKQACLERRCPNLAVQEADDSEPEEDGEVEADRPEETSKRVIKWGRHVTGVRTNSTVHWTGKVVASDKTGTYYRKVKVDSLEFGVGDFVGVESKSASSALLIGKVIYLYEDAHNGPLLHAQWLIRGTATVLGETSDARELFLHKCGFAYVSAVRCVTKVIWKKPTPEWHMRGGEPESAVLRNDGKTFFYQKYYDERTGRIEDIPGDPPCPAKAILHRYCGLCERNFLRLLEQRPDVAPAESREEGAQVKTFSLVRWNGQEYRVGQGVYLDPAAFKFKSFWLERKKERSKSTDDVLYPELYRKTSNRVKGSNESTSAPYCIGLVTSIFSKANVSDPLLLQMRDIQLRVTKMYRPENTCRGAEAVHQLDINMLYWSNQDMVISLPDIKGKCFVMFSENINMPESEWAAAGPDRFYFRQAYDPKSKLFDDPPSSAIAMGPKGKGKGKGKGKRSSSKASTEEVSHLLGPEWPPLTHRLRTLDLFAGCGGLSEGLQQAGISQPMWAVEHMDSAAKAFRLNNPSATVFTEDCNVLLKQIIEGKTTWKGQKLPKKGEVEFLCGGPPCQGFSGMNRFNSRQYSIFKNSLIVTMLSYCDYYRPRYFILENVRNFVAYKRGIVLKLTLRCLVQMGYQCTFGVLQAGNFGVPQTRRRAFILAAAPGEKLPEFPAPLHVFSPRAGELTIQVDGKKYKPTGQWVSAPYRTITVRDAMSDLPEISNGNSKEEMSYVAEPLSHFQRMMRGNQYEPILRDHICKMMNPLVEARISNIPSVPGADWRDLPNIEVQLSNGEVMRKLVYSHHDRKQGKSPSGALRGVCSCAEGKPCDPLDHQKNTLIPWCLPHTANRHNHWAGLYGRLEWDGFFSTTVTNPEPMGKQGRVLHPEQTRVVSVRECARSQGFPDSFRFYGKVIDKHRQIGNAVPPPMARAIGLQIRKCLSLMKASTSSAGAARVPVSKVDTPASGVGRVEALASCEETPMDGVEDGASTAPTGGGESSSTSRTDTSGEEDISSLNEVDTTMVGEVDSTTNAANTPMDVDIPAINGKDTCTIDGEESQSDNSIEVNAPENRNDAPSNGEDGDSMLCDIDPSSNGVQPSSKNVDTSSNDVDASSNDVSLNDVDKSWNSLDTPEEDTHFSDSSEGTTRSNKVPDKIGRSPSNGVKTLSSEGSEADKDVRFAVDAVRALNIREKTTNKVKIPVKRGRSLSNGAKTSASDGLANATPTNEAELPGKRGRSLSNEAKLSSKEPIPDIEGEEMDEEQTLMISEEKPTNEIKKLRKRGRPKARFSQASAESNVTMQSPTNEVKVPDRRERSKASSSGESASEKYVQVAGDAIQTSTNDEKAPTNEIITPGRKGRPRASSTEGLISETDVTMQSPTSEVKMPGRRGRSKTSSSEESVSDNDIKVTADTIQTSTIDEKAPANEVKTPGRRGRPKVSSNEGSVSDKDVEVTAGTIQTPYIHEKALANEVKTPGRRGRPKASPMESSTSETDARMQSPTHEVKMSGKRSKLKSSSSGEPASNINSEETADVMLTLSIDEKCPSIIDDETETKIFKIPGRRGRSKVLTSEDSALGRDSEATVDTIQTSSTDEKTGNEVKTPGRRGRPKALSSEESTSETDVTMPVNEAKAPGKRGKPKTSSTAEKLELEAEAMQPPTTMVKMTMKGRSLSNEANAFSSGESASETDVDVVAGTLQSPTIGEKLINEFKMPSKRGRSLSNGAPCGKSASETDVEAAADKTQIAVFGENASTNESKTPGRRGRSLSNGAKSTSGESASATDIEVAADKIQFTAIGEKLPTNENKTTGRRGRSLSNGGNASSCENKGVNVTADAIQSLTIGKEAPTSGVKGLKNGGKTPVNEVKTSTNRVKSLMNGVKAISSVVKTRLSGVKKNLQ